MFNVRYSVTSFKDLVQWLREKLAGGFCGEVGLTESELVRTGGPAQWLCVGGAGLRLRWGLVIAGTIVCMSLLPLGFVEKAADTTGPPVRIAVTDISIIPDTHALTLADDGLNATYEEVGVEDILTTDADAIWIAVADIAELVSNGTMEDLRKLLDRGKVIAFVTDEFPADALQALGFPIAESTSEGNGRLYGVYVWKDADGILCGGSVYTVGHA